MASDLLKFGYTTTTVNTNNVNSNSSKYLTFIDLNVPDPA